MENWEKVLEELFTGVMGMSDPTVWVMFAIGAVLIWLGVKKDYEPMLLFPMGVGCILANIPGHFAVIPTDGGEPGFLSVLYQAGIANELFPVLIFIAVGAMCEFDALIRAPYVMLFAAAAHFGILQRRCWRLSSDFLLTKRHPLASSGQRMVRPPFSSRRNLRRTFSRP